MSVAKKNLSLQTGLALLPPLVCCAMILAHANYPALAWRLANKHSSLARADTALRSADAPSARRAALNALAYDPDSALARVALARAALLGRDTSAALADLDAAISALPAHPHAHVLRGDLLRAQGHPDAARRELVAYEQASLEDLQSWLWDRCTSAPPALLDLGDGLDLGFVRGFHAAEQGGWRWTTATADLQLMPLAGAQLLRLRLAPGRPAGAIAPNVAVLVNGIPVGTLQLNPGWQVYTFALPSTNGPFRIQIQADTFTPRDYDPASADGRTLGVMVDWAEVSAEG